MNTVINLKEFKACGREPPTLLLIDLHHDDSGLVRDKNDNFSCEPLANCQAVLRHARASRMPVAFTRLVTAPPTMLTSQVYPRWIEGMKPGRWDMIFDRDRPSCYSSVEFCEIADGIRGNYVIAGRFGELSCLSTAIDAFHRDHRPIVLSDAVMCREHAEVPGGAMSRTLSLIFSHYARTSRTQAWIHASSRRIGAVT